MSESEKRPQSCELADKTLEDCVDPVKPKMTPLLNKKYGIKNNNTNNIMPKRCALSLRTRFVVLAKKSKNATPPSTQKGAKNKSAN
jgi:hypothetical protein